NFITFKSVVKAISAINGLYASFMPKPIDDKSGSGLHINLSLSKNGANIFKQGISKDSDAGYFIAGVLDKIAEITAFANPLINSYARLGSFEAPKYISWSRQNRSQLIRIPAAAGEYERMELRSPDPACNPYLTFALVLHAGLDGIEKKLELPEPTDFNIYKADSEVLKNLKALPDNLEQALDIMSRSKFVERILTREIIDKYLEIKLAEWNRYARSNDKNIVKQMYFKII
ncbi:MAG: type I glutamate--ammonia ligase, partial [Bacillota bacterium]